jgi:glycerol-3-phosphate acyltransferase PlsY
MMAADLLKTSLLLLAGYLIGSISPSYLLGRVLRRQDIRRLGNGNAGTVNTYKSLGLWPAVLTAVFDLAKGLAAMGLAYKFGQPPLFIHLAGWAAILGHIFPFYLRFRGGQGVATTVGLLLYYLILFYVRGWLPWHTLPLLAFLSLSFAYICRKGEVMALVVIPLLSLLVALFVPRLLYQSFLLSLLAYILLRDILNLNREKYFRQIPAKTEAIIGWRLYLRPLAALFVLILYLAGEKTALLFIGSIALLFLILDLTRLSSRRVNAFFFESIKDVFKAKEHKKFSSITIFLMAVFLTVLLVQKKLAALAVLFLIFGDFFSKIFGLTFGRTRIFHKTLEGSLAHLAACLASAYMFTHFVPVAWPVWLTGAATATAAEVLPLGVDDNFSVALLSAAVMSAFQLF